MRPEDRRHKTQDTEGGVQFWTSHFKKDSERLEHVPRKAMEHKFDEEQLRELGGLSLDKRRLRRGPFCLQHLKGDWSQVLFSQAASDRMIGNGFNWRFSLILGEISLQKGW